jgi:tRNA modification GTPase
MQGDTIYALSSGQPPSAIAVVRISGPDAAAALQALAGKLPEARRATLGRLSDPETGELLDNGLMLFFPGPASATGEDVGELHLHGGRSVVRAVVGALSRIAGLREAQPGEFTRRAFENGRIDLAEAEGLADLLLSETESQRRTALALAGGGLSRTVHQWNQDLLSISAQLEAVLDFADEGDVEEEVRLGSSPQLIRLIDEIRSALDRPSAERLRDGVRIAIAGPPNSGKSSLLNWLAGRPAAITSTVAGTTRDLVEAPTVIGGMPFLLIDTAGLRESEDEVETIGIQRAREALETADLVLWLGDAETCPEPNRSIRIRSKCDLSGIPASPEYDLSVSAVSGEGMDALVQMLTVRSRALLPREGEVALNARHRQAVSHCLKALEEARESDDLVVASELLRQARAALDGVTGRAGVEHMLDALFGRFCIGK